MRIHSVTLHNIRNHTDSTIEVAPHVNVLCGMNGHGKTSVLEAISLCALSTTFVPCDDKALIRRGEESCFASVNASTDLQTPYKVSVQISTKERKHISSSLGKRLSPQDIIGELPIVALSPDFKSITAGAPADRRKFLDSLLSQASKRAMNDLLTLKKILKQRNTILHEGKTGHHVDTVLLETWTDALAEVSAAIALKRWEFVQEFAEYTRLAYEDIARGRGEQVGIRYEPDALPADVFEATLHQAPTMEHLRAAYSQVFQSLAAQERKRGVTCAGPQKDELVFTVDGGIAREAASQGQHKTLLIALKTAEFRYLRDIRAETPVLLLDDVFSELDSTRAANVFGLLQSGAQTFVTTTDPQIFYDHFSASDGHALFTVNDGMVKRER